jgi:hypothetical protein
VPVAETEVIPGIHPVQTNINHSGDTSFPNPAATDKDFF